MITKDDVKNVADSLHISITDEQVQAVVDNYPSYEELDPTGTWNLIIEQAIYDVIDM